MLALIGFVVLLLLGGGFCFVGLFAGFVTGMFSGRFDWVPFFFFTGVGAILLCIAFKLSPISIQWAM